MPFKDPGQKRKYQREWIADRRAEYFKGKCCVQCGYDDLVGLELDHINRKEKVSHKIWSWSKVRREAELAKCQVLCNLCHSVKTLQDIADWRAEQIDSETAAVYDTPINSWT